MSENLYHKLLGLPERLESPNYFDMLELDQGAIDTNKVETAYKKQIQKVQRFTNNPKYKAFPPAGRGAARAPARAVPLPAAGDKKGLLCVGRKTTRLGRDA